MFQSAAQSNLIDMCDDCRINAQWAADDGLSFAQGAAVTPSRPRLRTTDDYLEADRHGLSVDDFLKDN